MTEFDSANGGWFVAWPEVAAVWASASTLPSDANIGTGSDADCAGGNGGDGGAMESEDEELELEDDGKDGSDESDSQRL